MSEGIEIVQMARHAVLFSITLLRQRSWAELNVDIQ